MTFVASLLVRIFSNRPKTSAHQPDSALESDSPAAHCADDKTNGVADSPAISDAEAANLRNEKLATIRQAIADGAYDSDDLLIRALDRMRAAIQNGEESGS